MNEIEQDYADIFDWQLIQSKTVRNNSRIISNKDINQDYMLHIDKNMPKIFIPKMPASAASSENDTCARITVSPILIGCLIGYARADNDLLSGAAARRDGKNKFRGGYIISELPFTHCIQPNDKLVFDASRSLEHWLVSYNRNTTEVKSKEIGKMFISSILTQGQSGKFPSNLITMYITHDKAGGIKFSENNHLEAGYYKAEVFFKDQHDRDHLSESDFTIRKVDQSEYQEAKNQCAALLAYKEKPTPNYYKW